MWNMHDSGRLYGIDISIYRWLGNSWTTLCRFGTTPQTLVGLSPSWQCLASLDATAVPLVDTRLMRSLMPHSLSQPPLPLFMPLCLPRSLWPVFVQNRRLCSVVTMFSSFFADPVFTWPISDAVGPRELHMPLLTRCVDAILVVKVSALCAQF